MNKPFRRMAVAGLALLFIAGSGEVSRRIWQKDYDVFQQSLRESAIKGMAPYLKKAIAQDSCDTNNQGIANQFVFYKGHGKIRILGWYLNRYKGYLFTRKLGALYEGKPGTANEPAVATNASLALAGDDNGRTYVAYGTPSAACRKKLLAQFDPKIF